MIPRSSREPLIRPIARLTSPALRLYLTAFSLLFTELVLIRWIPAEITYVGFFSNFLLIGSFLGIGIGILAGRRFTGARVRALPIGLFIPVLFITVRFVTAVQLNVQVRATDEVFFGLAENSGAADINFVVLPLAVGLATLLMAVLALPLGPLLRASRRCARTPSTSWGRCRGSRRSRSCRLSPPRRPSGSPFWD